MIYFVSRHSGAIKWAEEEGFTVDKQLTHINHSIIRDGDVVIGTLPVHLVAEICARGGRYLHLSIDIPESWRGSELTSEHMRACHARLETYQVSKVA